MHTRIVQTDLLLLVMLLSVVPLPQHSCEPVDLPAKSVVCMLAVQLVLQSPCSRCPMPDLTPRLFVLQVLDEQDSRLKVNISAGQNSGYQMKTHPKNDKALYSSQSVLGLKDPQTPFPAGSPLGILKWRMQVLLPHTPMVQLL